MCVNTMSIQSNQTGTTRVGSLRKDNTLTHRLRLDFVTGPSLLLEPAPRRRRRRRTLAPPALTVQRARLDATVTV